MSERTEHMRGELRKTFTALPIPGGKKDENYRFSPWLGRALKWLDEERIPASAGTAKEYTSTPDQGEAGLLTLSGQEQKIVLAPSSAIEFGSLREENSSVGILPKAFAQDKVASYCGANWSTGSYTRVPEGISVKGVLRVSEQFTDATSAARHLVLLERGASATVVIESSSLNTCLLANELIEMRVGEGAALKLFILQGLADASDLLQRLHATLGERATLVVAVLSSGTQAYQCRAHTRLAGRGATLEFDVNAAGKNSQGFDFWAEVEHASSETKSDMKARFVLDDKARSVFNGLIRIAEGARKCEAYQRTRALLLSKEASAVVLPKLMIANDDVKCSHGASISSIDPEQMHYLLSRGISKEEAQEMIVNGFIAPTRDMIADDMLRARAEKLLLGTAEAEKRRGTS